MFNLQCFNAIKYLKGTYHAKCTCVRLVYMNMCPRCSRELTKCQKTQPSLFSSIPKSLKTGLQLLFEFFWRQKRGAPPIWGMRRRSTYARPVSGAVVWHKSRISPCKNRAGKEQIERNEAWLKCMICLVFCKKNFTDMFYIGMALQYMFQI